MEDEQKKIVLILLCSQTEGAWKKEDLWGLMGRGSGAMRSIMTRWSESNYVVDKVHFGSFNDGCWHHIKCFLKDFISD